MSIPTQTTAWWYGMSFPDLAVHFIMQEGPMTAGQLGRRLVESGVPLVSTPARSAHEGIKRAVAQGRLVHRPEGGYGLKESADAK